MHSHRWYWVPAAALLAFVPASGRSGERQDEKGQQAKPPGDAPGPMHKHLGVLAGSWDVASTFRIGGKENHGKARCEAKWILNGRFIQQEYQSKLNGEPFAVLQILGYDNNKKKSIEIMMDTMGTGIMHNEGSMSEDGKLIRNDGELRDPQTGKFQKLRTVTTVIDEDHFTLEWLTQGPDGTFEPTVSLKHTRRKS